MIKAKIEERKKEKKMREGKIVCVFESADRNTLKLKSAHVTTLHMDSPHILNPSTSAR